MKNSAYSPGPPLTLLAALCVAGFLMLAAFPASGFPAPRPSRPTRAPAADTSQASASASAPAQGPSLSPKPSGPAPLSTVVTSWEGVHTDFTLEPPDPPGASGPNGY